MIEQNDLYDPTYVKEVFDRCSDKYIAFSYFMSMGFTERWRRQCVALLGEDVPADATGYDLMAGTGEVWPHLFRAYPNLTKITAVDISEGMHRRALDRLHQNRNYDVAFVQDNVLESELTESSADFVIATFGLKTFNLEQLETLAKLTARVLKPGGRFAFIEASDPRGWWLRPFYLFHLKQILPLVERLFLRGAQDFSHIGTYSLQFRNAERFGTFLRNQRLVVRDQKHFFGCASSVSGLKKH